MGARTKKFRDRVPPTDAAAPEEPTTTVLGDWYATMVFWRPQVALFVNELTLLPVLMPFAPAASTLERVRVAAAEVLSAHGVRRSFVDRMNPTRGRTDLPGGSPRVS